MTPFIIQAGSGIFLIIGGWILKKYPPQKMNALYGYRTGRAYQSKEAWDFAQKYSAIMLIRSSMFLLLISPVYLVICVDHFSAIILSIILVLLCPFMPIYFTEKALKKRFPKM